MTLPAPLEVFLLSIQIVVASGAPGDQIVKAVEPRLAALVGAGDWLPGAFRRSLHGKQYAQYLLHRPADWSFSIEAFVVE